MICFGKKGKIDGIWILTRLVQGGLVFVSNENVAYQNGKHRLLRVSFSEQLKNEQEIAENIQTVVENFILAYDACEVNPVLFCPKEELGYRIRRMTSDRDLTGIFFLNLFANRDFQILDLGETCYEVNVPEWVYEEIPLFRRKVNSLIHTLLRYSGEDEDISVNFIREKQPQTESISGDLTVTYDAEENLHPVETSSSVQNQEVQDTLLQLKKMMEDLDESREQGICLENIRLSFDEGKWIENDQYKICVPEGFLAVEETEDHPLILWYPNQENPSEWEASGLRFTWNPEKNEFEYDLLSNISLEEAEKIKEALQFHMMRKEDTWQ